MKCYRTAEIAALVGVHPNTVRFYEEQGLLPAVPRRENGYRVYTERHLLQLRLIRLAFRAEILSGSLRGEVIDIVKLSAGSALKRAAEKTVTYQMHVREEMGRAREAVDLAERIASGESVGDPGPAVGRREAATALGVSVDVLRDWERNGLLQVPREGNRRRYGRSEMDRLNMIRLLRNANYSQMSIRRTLQKLERGPTDLLSAIDTPEPTEEIVSVADRYITSLLGALQDTEAMLQLLYTMQSAGRN